MVEIEQFVADARDGEEGEVAEDSDSADNGDEEENVLRFLDSLDSYIVLVDSLSSTLRQGWLELASARHSMGSSRISTTLLDHKVQSAATTVQVTESLGDHLSGPKPVFTLSKWATREESYSPEDVEHSGLQKRSNHSELRHRGPSNFLDSSQESNSAGSGSQTATTSTVIQKERSKSLAVFGTLVSPKLRAAQISFEKALDGIVEIANSRSSMLSAFSQLELQKKEPS
ncbi:uncharacterized protein [Typha latifolia]|uniref:uncharacterized protein isoform X1 n=1 Tax=Typha latifolia TaxID=4733 RepID=UPI003C305FC6